MSRKRLVSVRQMVLLTEFLEKHQELTHGKMMSREAIALSSRLWRQCAFILNAEGESRTPKEWQKWFTDYKCRLLGKAKQRKNSSDTGDEIKTPPLSRLEEKLCSLLSQDNSKRGRTEISPKKRLVSVRQMVLLTEYLEQHPELALGRMRNREAVAVASRLWRQCAGLLNSEGESRTAKEWQKWFTDYKSRLLTKSKQRMNTTADGTSKEYPPLSRLEERLFSLVSQGYSRRRKSALDDGSSEPEDVIKSKTKPYSNFKVVRKCCIELVTIHGRPADLFADEAFKQLLELIPMTQEERNKITPKYIVKMIKKESVGKFEESNECFVDVKTNMDIEEAQNETTLKNEVHCNCNAIETGGDSPRHDTDCPAASCQPYWDYFQVSLDVATCSICEQTIGWCDVTDLREHLNSKHGNTKYSDANIATYDVNDISFQRSPSSNSASSHEDMQEIYLHEPDLTAEASNSTKKHKNSTKTSQSEPRLERFKNLDRFGMYISSLMRLIPKDKCLKYQLQIVEKLVEIARRPNNKNEFG